MKRKLSIYVGLGSFWGFSLLETLWSYWLHTCFGALEKQILTEFLFPCRWSSLITWRFRNCFLVILLDNKKNCMTNFYVYCSCGLVVEVRQRKRNNFLTPTLPPSTELNRFELALMIYFLGQWSFVIFYNMVANIYFYSFI